MRRAFLVRFSFVRISQGTLKKIVVVAFAPPGVLKQNQPSIDV